MGPMAKGAPNGANCVMGLAVYYLFHLSMNKTTTKIQDSTDITQADRRGPPLVTGQRLESNRGRIAVGGVDEADGHFFHAFQGRFWTGVDRG